MLSEHGFEIKLPSDSVITYIEHNKAPLRRLPSPGLSTFKYPLAETVRIKGILAFSMSYCILFTA